MSTIFKTRISQQEVQTPVVSADTVVTDNFIASSIQSESVSSENINAITVQGEEIIATDLSTENIAISNDLSIGQDVIVPSGNVLVGRKGIVSFVDDGEEVDENGASGFPIYNGVPEVLNNSTIYDIGLIDKDTDLSGMTFGGNDEMVQTCEIWFSIGDETHDIYWPENMLWLDSTDGNAPAIVVRTEYRVAIRKEANGSMVASIAYAVGEGQQNVDEMIRTAAQKDGDNIFTGANTFTGSVDMSGAQVTPPEGWSVEGAELTAEAISEVVPFKVNSNGQVLINGSCESDSSLIVSLGAGGAVSRVAIGGHIEFQKSMTIGGTATWRGVSVGADSVAKEGSVAIGTNAKAENRAGVSVGENTISANYACALSCAAQAAKERTVAIGYGAKANDYGAVVFRSAASDGTITQLYFSGANTPLATQYENGEAMMGYVVTDSNGNVLTDAEGNAMIGTQKLSVLFPNNRGENAFTPAMLGLDDEWTPKPMFRPSDLDLPDIEIEEPEIEEI